MTEYKINSFFVIPILYARKLITNSIHTCTALSEVSFAGEGFAIAWHNTNKGVRCKVIT